MVCNSLLYCYLLFTFYSHMCAYAFVFTSFHTGHGGSYTSKFIKDNLSSIVTKNMMLLCKQCELEQKCVDVASVSHLLESAFIQADSLLAAEPRMEVKIKPPRQSQAGVGKVELDFMAIDNSGSTACLCLVGPTDFITANIGDSRAVLAQYRQDTGVFSVNMSNDHKPNLENELNRITKAGCRLVN